MRGAALLIAVVVGAAILGRCAGMGGGVPQLPSPSWVVSMGERRDQAVIPALVMAARASAEVDAPFGDAEAAADAASGADWLTVGDERHSRVSDRYTRVRPAVYGGRFGGRRDLTARSSCGSSRRAEPAVVVAFEDGGPAVGAELLGPSGTILAVVGSDGVARSPTGRDVAQPGSRGPWFLHGRRLHLKGTRRDARSDGLPVVELWSAPRELRGTVVDQHGAPVAGVVVHLRGTAAHAVTTDDAGRFALDGETPSRLSVEVEHPRLFRHPMPDWIAEGMPGPAEVTVRAVRGDVHDVLVADDDGAGLAGATVRYRYRWPAAVDGRRPDWTYAATADAAGLARLLVVPGAELEADIECRGFPRRDLRGLADVMPLRLERRLRNRTEPTWLPVRCRDGATGADIRPPTVLARLAEQPWIVADVLRGPYRAICHPEAGADFEVCDLEDLPAGRWEVFCWSPRCDAVVVSGEATAGGIYPPLDVRLVPGLPPLRVTVADQAGLPVDGAQVRVAAVAGRDGFLHPARFAGSERTEAGACRFELPAGDYEVRVEARGFATQVHQVTLARGSGVVDVRLWAGQ